MRKTAFLFSGQGSQYVGMGSDFADIGAVREVFACGSDILGYDLRQKIDSSTKEELSETVVSQPAIFATSLAALAVAHENGISADGIAGHSLGEYAALVAAGVLDMESGFKAIKLRSEAMQRVAMKNPGGMAAVISNDTEMIEAVCKTISDSGEYLVAVNYNSPQQTVIAGTEKAIESATTMFKDKGVRRVVRLAVSAAFHSALMQEAADELAKKLGDFQYRPATLPFYSNITGGLLTDFSEMPSYLAKQVVSPVRFTTELRTMQADGFDTFIELGPDRVLTGLVKKTLDGVTALNIENNDTLTATKEQLNADI